MKQRLSLTVALAAALMAVAPGMAAAQESAAEAPAEASTGEETPLTAKSPEGDEIVVIGNRIPDEEVREYITNLLLPEVTGQDKYYPVHNAPLCPTVYGLEEPSKTAVVDRMKAVARVSGIKVDEDADCSPTLVVMTVEDGKESIKRWRTKFNRRHFGWIDPPMRDTIVRTGGPAYAWHVVDMGLADMGGTGALGGPAVMAGTGYEFAGGNIVWSNEVVRHGGMRIRYPESIYRAFVIVERGALENVSETQFADYALMRGMMQIKFDGKATQGVDSILNLFAAGKRPEDAPPSLTRADLGMLSSLYLVRNDVTANRQRGDMIKPFQRVMAYGEEGIERKDD